MIELDVRSPTTRRGKSERGIARKLRASVLYPPHPVVGSRLAFDVYEGEHWMLHVTAPDSTADAVTIKDVFLWDILDLDGDGVDEWIVTPSRDPLDARRSAGGHLGDVGVRGRVQLTKLERGAGVTPFVHVHPVEHERVEVDVEPERTVSSLHGDHRTRVRVRDAREPELSLCSPPERVVHLCHERAHHLGAELAVVTEQCPPPGIPKGHAQAPGQAADPVTDAHAWQDALLQVQRRIRHPSAQT